MTIPREAMENPWGGPWRRVGVYGAGLSGKAAAALLRRRGARVVLWDGRDAAAVDLGELASDPGVEARLGGEPTAADAAGLAAVVTSPGVPLDRPLLAAARERGIPVLAEVELAFPFLQGEVVAITGSNGKSTTTAMAGAILRRTGRPVEVCGNIGVPLAALVDGPPGRTFVVELSSFQLETTELFRPRAAALLNLSPDHLDRHGSLAGYLAAKARIFRRQEAGDVAVLNADDPHLRDLEPASRRRVFSRRGPVRDGCHVDGDVVVEVAPDAAPRELFVAADLPVPGPHNLENAMAAALLALAVGATPDDVREGLRGFRGLAHRLERVRERGGVVFYDDSKGTNVGATLASLAGFADGTVHLVLGGRNKGADLGELRPLVAAKARAVYLVGEAADEMERALAGAVATRRSGTLDRAVAAAADAARPGESVVLSPACASFDQFTSYVHRGETFQRLVRELPEAGDGA